MYGRNQGSPALGFMVFLLEPKVSVKHVLKEKPHKTIQRFNKL